MTEQLKAIGQRLQAMREAVDLSVEEMAEKTGLPVEDYIKYEDGQMDFSFSFLYRAANILGIDVMDLMSGETPRLNMCTLIRKGEGISIERVKAYKYQHLAYTFRNKIAEPFMVTVAYDPDGKMPHLNSHEGQEFDYMLEGKLEVSIGGRKYVLNEGDSIYYDSSYPHAMRAVDGDARFLAVVMGKGKDE